MKNNALNSFQRIDKIDYNHQEESIDYGENCNNTSVISDTANKQGYSISNEQHQPKNGKPFLKFFFIKDNHKPYLPLTILANTIFVKNSKRIIKRLTTKCKQNLFIALAFFIMFGISLAALFAGLWMLQK